MDAAIRYTWSTGQRAIILQVEHWSRSRDLDLRRPIYRQTAAYGHFGRDDISLPWENTDRAEALRAAAGL